MGQHCGSWGVFYEFLLPQSALVQLVLLTSLLSGFISK